MNLWIKDDKITEAKIKQHSYEKLVQILSRLVLQCSVSSDWTIFKETNSGSYFVLASAATESAAVNRYQNSIQIFFIPKMNMVHKNSWVPVCLDDSNTPIVTLSTEFPMFRIVQLPFSFINNSFFNIFSSICYLEGLWW